MLPYEAIDHVILPCASFAAVVQPLSRLGWRGIAPPNYLGGLPSSRCFFVGREQRLFHLEAAEESAQHPLNTTTRQAVEEKRGLCGVVLRVRDLNAVLREFAQREMSHTVVPSASPNGAAMARVAVDEAAGVPLYLQEYAISTEEQTAEVEAEDGLNHELPIRRLDHLAAVARNLDAQTHFWTQILGVPLFGEVITPAMIIRQFKIGDAIIELLGPASADSPLHQRAPGLISMMSLEVPDLNAVVAQAKSAGFAISDPAPGVLPGTATSTIPASETGGIALQMLQYV